MFNVGNLLLSSGVLSRSVNNGTLTVEIDGADGAGAVTIAEGAQLASSGYTALVAPRVRQYGRIRAGGTAALVAGEDVTLTIRDDLFDIQIDLGASGPANATDYLIEHRGETISNALQGGGPHRVYIAGVAQEDAMTILLGGVIQAQQATVDKNGIVLSAGGGITDGEASPAGGGQPVDLVFDRAPAGEGSAYSHLSDSGFQGRASGSIVLPSGSGLRSAGALTLDAGLDLNLGGNRIDAVGPLTLTARRDVLFAGSQVDAGSLMVRAGDDIAVSADSRLTTTLGRHDPRRQRRRRSRSAELRFGQCRDGLGAGHAGQRRRDGCFRASGRCAERERRIDRHLRGYGRHWHRHWHNRHCRRYGAGALRRTAAGPWHAWALSPPASASPSAPLAVWCKCRGVIAGESVTVTSADIGIGASGRIVGSRDLTLVPDTAGGVVLGGPSGTGGYRLDAEEMSRLQSAEVTVAPSRAADVTIGDMRLQGSQATGDARGLLGDDGAFRVRTEGSIDVGGNVQLDNAAAGNTLEFDAGQRLTVVIPAGGIAVRSSTGGLGGILRLKASDILIADSSIRNLVAAQPSAAELASALAVASTGLSADGHVSAGQFFGEARDSLYVQNTGNNRVFGGVRARNLTLTGTGAGSTNVILYGQRRESADGDVTDFRLGDVTDLTTDFSGSSSINGCLISAASCLGEVPRPVLAPDGRTVTGLVGTEEQGNPTATSPRVPTTQLVDASDFEVTGPVVIEEPVTGAGNPESWQVRPECPEEDREQCR